MTPAPQDLRKGGVASQEGFGAAGERLQTTAKLVGRSARVARGSRSGGERGVGIGAMGATTALGRRGRGIGRILNRRGSGAWG